MTPTDETRVTHPFNKPPILQRKWIDANGRAVWRDEARELA